MAQSSLNFDIPLARAAKDLGQSAAISNEDNEWLDSAFAHLTSLARRNARFTSDEFRRECLGSGMSHPHHPNVWGAVMGKAAKLHLIRNSGEYVASKVIGNHCRKIPVWVSLVFRGVGE